MSQDAFGRLADRLENNRDRWRNDPVGWVEHRLGGTLWSKQREIAELVVNHKRVAVRSCHAAGKTRLAATLAAWWIDVHPPGEALVITTALSYAQVHGVFWEEVRKIHAAAGLDGKVLGSDRWLLDDGTLVGVGRRPIDPSSWQGYHRKFVLAIMDEACGIPAWVWTSMETITTSESCRILAISNPDDNASEFARIATTDPSWRSVKISAFDTPAFTGEPIPAYLTERLIDQEWVSDKRARWTVESPLWRSKVEAEFADAEAGLIPFSWITAANARWHDWNDRPTRDTQQPAGRRVFGVDPAWSERGDRTAIATRQGDIVITVDAYQGLDTTQTTGLVQAKLRGAPDGIAVLDVVGLGVGVLDQLRRARCNVVAFNGSRSTGRRDATGEWRFPNMRSASYWNLRELLDPALGGKLALPPNDDLAAELCAPRYEFRSGGMLVIEAKDATKKRIGRSPDLADAVVYSCWTELGSADRDFDPDGFRHRQRGSPYRIDGVPWVGFTDPGPLPAGHWGNQTSW